MMDLLPCSLKVSENMIRRLHTSDQTSLLTYVGQEPSINNFIIGDIEHFGFDVDFIFVYGEFNTENEYLSVLLFYRDSVIYYSHLERFNEDWLDIFNQHKFKFISGKKRVLDLVYPHFSSFKKSEMYFAEATSFVKPEKSSLYDIKLLTTREDCNALFDLLEAIKEFAYVQKAREDFINDKMTSLKMGETYLIEENNIVIASVAATAETTLSAVVVAVATLPSMRNKGLATALMCKLMDQYINVKNKALCLFYDNPKAGNIYKRLGFKEMDMWVMLSKE